MFQPLTDMMYAYCVSGESADGNIKVSRATRNKACLTLGGLIYSLKKNGQNENALKLATDLHDKLGLHGRIT